MSRRSGVERRGQSAGWRAFALGMIAMFAAMGLWVALAETAEAPNEGAGDLAPGLRQASPTQLETQAE